jgi:hypothetical protein
MQGAGMAGVDVLGYTLSDRNDVLLLTNMSLTTPSTVGSNAATRSSITASNRSESVNRSNLIDCSVSK